MPKQKVFVTRVIPEPGISLLEKAGFDVDVYMKDQIIPYRELIKRSKGADGVLSLLTESIDANFFKKVGGQLKIVANYAVGYNNIDVKAAQDAGVMVTNTPAKLLSNAVAEHTIALIFAVTKNIAIADRYTRGGKYKGWSPTLFLGPMLQGKTLGVVGAGRIGTQVAVRARAMGMKVIYTDLQRNQMIQKEAKAKYVKDRLEMLKQADVVSIHVPLVKATHHLMGRKEFKAMKKTAYLINTSRGPVIDEKALTIALEKGHIAGAGLDVYECEPAIDCDLTDTHALRKLNNVVLTPHIASATIDARAEMAELAAKNVIAALKGKKPKNLVS